jgi:hypothetical protein
MPGSVPSTAGSLVLFFLALSGGEGAPGRSSVSRDYATRSGWPCSAPECGRARARDGMIILDGGARDADRLDDAAIATHEGHAAGESDEVTIGDLDLVERSSRLGEFTKRSSWEVEEADGTGLLDSDVDATQLGPIHACAGFEVGSGIDNGDVHLDTMSVEAAIAASTTA